MSSLFPTNLQLTTETKTSVMIKHTKVSRFMFFTANAMNNKDFWIEEARYVKYIHQGNFQTLRPQNIIAFCLGM